MQKQDQDTRASMTSDHFLSKEEVEALIENFNTTIEDLKIENGTLNPKLEEAKNKLVSLKTQKEQLNKEINEFKHKIEFYQPQLNEIINNQKGFYAKNPKINQLFQKYRIDDSKLPDKNNLTFEKAFKSEPILVNFEDNIKSETKTVFSQDKEYQNVDKIVKASDNKLSQQEKMTLQSALQMYITESQLLEKNEKKFQKLFSDSLNNREEVLKKEARLLVIQYCIHCKQRFSPLCNEEGSCVFHMGKLKFYSCKTCGCDEYYNCCNKCLKCCRGCSTGKHAAKEKVFRNELTPQSKQTTKSLSSLTDQDFYSFGFDNIQFITKKV